MIECSRCGKDLTAVVARFGPGVVRVHDFLCARDELRRRVRELTDELELPVPNLSRVSTLAAVILEGP